MKVHSVSKSLILVFFVTLLVAGSVSAQEVEPFPSDDDVNNIAKDMFCPVCENIPLDVCDTKACEQWRELIREKLSEGWTEKEIKDYFVLQYGDRVLAEPPARGLNWLVYSLPPLSFLVGIYIVYRVLSRMRKQTQMPTDTAETTESLPKDNPYFAKMEEELQKRKKS
ncbi:MAG: cytochrome c-type biogenesis protein CcmH [Anaerolineaceae bacterium]|nr:cytochrome c-type biogenesis protein CcmH [Anaerolineaceae bacterium]